MALNRDTVLQRLPSLRIELESGGRVGIRLDGRPIDLGPNALAVLDAFAAPRPLAEALDALSPGAGSQRWIDLTTTIVHLHRLGVLGDPAEALYEPPKNFDAAYVHVAMLHDTSRTSRYLEAIAEVVRPGDVVVDLGTGTGILAAAAVRAGARRVYAIESGTIARAAREFFHGNGLLDRITLVENWSTHVALPERADVLVSEIIGHDPLHEGVLESTGDACRRFLHESSRLIPARLRMFGLPVCLPEHFRERFSFTERGARRWQNLYGFDFSPLVHAGRQSALTFLVKRHEARDFSPLSEPLLLADIDLRENHLLYCENTATARIHDEGRIDALLLFFDLQLTTTLSLTTDPRVPDDSMHWQNIAWLFHDPIAACQGDLLEVVLHCDGRKRSVTAKIVPDHQTCVRTY